MSCNVDAGCSSALIGYRVWPQGNGEPIRLVLVISNMQPSHWEHEAFPLSAASLRGGLEHRRKGFKSNTRHSQTSRSETSEFAMKKRSLSIGGRPGPLSHAVQSQFSRPVSIPGCDIALRPIESLRADSAQLADCGLQQESQSKHPFLSRSGQPYSSQSQRLSLSQGCLTQSQNTPQFSQNSQPEDYGCDQWNRPGFLEKEISLSQPKPASPYFAGLTSSLNRRNVLGNVGGGSTPASSTGTSSALCFVGPQSSTPRPWPQCNVSEELEKRLGSLEKLREDETALLQKISEDYQQIKIFLEETCFESKDNRSKLALQQNELHKLLKEEETANSSILTAIKTSGEAILQDIRNLKQAAEEADVANKDIVSASFERMTESFREEVVGFKRDLKAELDVMKQSVPITHTQPQLPNLQLVPMTVMHHQLLPTQSHPRMGSMESTPKPSLDQSSLPISMSEVVDLDELPDCDLQNRSSLQISMPEVVDLDEFPDFDLDIGLAFLARDDACNLVAKRRNRLKKSYNITDEDIHKSVRAKMLRAQRRVRYKGMC